MSETVSKTELSITKYKIFQPKTVKTIQDTISHYHCGLQKLCDITKETNDRSQMQTIRSMNIDKTIDIETMNSRIAMPVYIDLYEIYGIVNESVDVADLDSTHRILSTMHNLRNDRLTK